MEGLRVGVTAARRGADLVSSLERRGAAVTWGPTLAGDRSEDAHAVAALRGLVAEPPAWLVVSTATALRCLTDAAERTSLGDALRTLLGATHVVARGAKAHGAVRAAGVEPVFVSLQETDRDAAAWLAGHVLPGDRVAVLTHGDRDTGAYAGVEQAGGGVSRVRVYESAAPTDAAPARALVASACSGGLDAVVCTSPGAVRNLVRIADEDGSGDDLVAAFSNDVAVAVTGPVTARAVEEAGAPVSVMPLRQRSGDLVRALQAWADRGPRVLGGPVCLAPGGEARVKGRPVPLGPRELEVLAALVRRPRVVVAPSVLAVQVWGHAAPDDPAAVKHLVSRVRRKLGPFSQVIETVRGVGYRYDPTGSS